MTLWLTSGGAAWPVSAGTEAEVLSAALTVARQGGQRVEVSRTRAGAPLVILTPSVDGIHVQRCEAACA